MSILKMIYLIVVMILSATLCGCLQGVKHKEERKNQTFKVSENQSTTTKSNQEEKPSVIYRSTDLGKSWSSFGHGIPENATLSGIKEDGNKIYVTTDYHGIFLSTDCQNNWQGLNFDKLRKLDINCIEIENNKLVIGNWYFKSRSLSF